MTLRRRLALMIAPLVVLILAVGAAGVWLLDDLGRRSDAILRENYLSLQLMADLGSELDTAESIALQVAVADGDPDPRAREKFRGVMQTARGLCDRERANITVPGEGKAAGELSNAVDEMARRGERLFDLPPEARRPFFDRENARGFQAAWFDAQVLARFIRLLNEGAMQDADRAARHTARRSAWVLGGATVAALLLAAVAAAGLLRTILRPVTDLTRMARAVGDGKFDQLAVADTHDEIGELVAAFNRMTAQLRDLRQTAAARLLRAQQASQAAIDAFPDPVLVVDRDGRVEMANPAAGRVLGVVPGGDHPGPVWSPPDRLREPLADALHAQQPFLSQSFDQAVNYHVAGEDRTFIPQVLPVRDPYGNTLGAAVVLNDVTRFRLLDEFKSDLVATASHELKTPLAGLRLAVHLILEEAVGPLAPKQAELLIDARENTERLVRIVDHLLSLARLEQGREPLAVRAADAGGLLRAAADRVGPRLADRKVEFDLDPAGVPPVAVDAERLGHALDNLLVNAATYTDAGGRIVLAARPAEDGFVELSVRDTGVGISAEHLPHVFDKFFRIPDQTRGAGTGLGLAIVREIVAAHGGRVACESAAGAGTTFRLFLPSVVNGS